MDSEIQTSTSSEYEILREVVQDYPGLLGSVEQLMQELNRHASEMVRYHQRNADLCHEKFLSP